MSDDSKGATFAELRALEDELEKRVAALEVEHACAIDELATRADERERRRRHHDVLCLVLKELLLERIKDPTTDILDGKALVNDARNIADLAYPPPKAEP